MKRVVLAVCFLLFSAVVFSQVPVDVKEALKNGSGLESSGNLEGALEAYLAGLKQNPNEDLYIKAGTLLGKMQKYQDGETLLVEGVGHFPKNTSLKNLLSVLKAKLNKKDEALQLLQEVLAQDPGNSFAQKEMAKHGKASPPDGAQPNTQATTAPSTESASSGGATAGYEPAPTGDKAAQEALALSLYEQMVQTDEQDLETFIDLHTQVIKKCPETSRAVESCWKLSNLFMIGLETPDKGRVAEVLEHMIKTYPDHELIPHAKSRILAMYQDLKDYKKVVGMYEEMFKNRDTFSDSQFRSNAMPYGEALMALGRKDEAKKLFEEVVQKKDEDAIECQIAEDYLKNM